VTWSCLRRAPNQPFKSPRPLALRLDRPIGLELQPTCGLVMIPVCLDWTVKTRVEMDLFNGNTSGVFPNMLDYEGPPGMMLMRQPIFSLHYNFTDKI
jgi:hypothetical protein